MNIDTYFALDKERLCDACGKKDYLICITYPLANLFQGMPSKKRAAVWFCSECATMLKNRIEEDLSMDDEVCVTSHSLPEAGRKKR